MKPIKLQIEERYGMAFDEFIKHFHFEKRMNLTDLASMSGFSRQSIASICDKQGVKRKSLAESIRRISGPEHWAFGMNKTNSEIHARSSARMREKNPSRSFETRCKSAIKRAEYFKANPYPQEIKAAKMLRAMRIKFVPQHPIGPFIIDFFIAPNICLEIDSTKKWGTERRIKAKEKDAFLESKGLIVLRIDKRKLDRSSILKILDAHNLVGHEKLIGSNPSPRC